jgi:hypothetical protein
VKQAFTNRLKTERRGEKGTYTGRLSYKKDVSLTKQNGIE